MDDETRASVERFIANWHGTETADDVMVELAAFQAHIGQLKRSGYAVLNLLDKGKITVHNFWGGLSRFPLLQEVALRVFTVCWTSSASERNFSSFGFVHTKLRNRLKEKRVEKLVFMFFNGKNLDSEDCELEAQYEELIRMCSKQSADDSDSD